LFADEEVGGGAKANVDGQRHDAGLLAQDGEAGGGQTSQMIFYIFGILQVPSVHRNRFSISKK
jgi:hypothetical protein